MRKKNKQKMVIALAMLFSVFFLACKKEDPNPNGGGGSGGTNQVSMQGSQFSPASITVSKGSAVTWINNENVVHTVTSNAGSFDSGDMANGNTFSFTFSNAGTFPYHCKHHSSMTGTVIVQ